ncbi:NUDIX domain-containing protein [Methanobrevibacter filiformis]|uniref:NUDIX domain-containing protein n=1 Tax=Methanobrevibacter filiformis TaxID=55758 RepID=UPI0008357889|nr:NUDIX hydrolase [Methanobrevibacter filiformis]
MKNYKKPSITVDILIFNENNKNINKNSEFILIKRKNDPFKDYWGIPGGFVDYGESTEEAAIREAKEETNININLESLQGVYSKHDRDPRGHTITIFYNATGDFNEMKADSDAKDINIFSYNDLEKISLAFDHNKILKDYFSKINKINE